MAFDSTTYKTPVEVDEVGQIILCARNLLSDPARWIKNVPSCGDRFCIIGAVYHVLGGRTDDGEMPPMYWPTIDRITHTINPEAAECDSLTVTDFNDRAGTKHADVLALLDRAARPTREGE